MAINNSPETQAMMSRAQVFSLIDLVTLRPRNAMTISDGIAVNGTKIPKINNCACTLASRVDLLGNIAIRTSHRNPTPHLPTRWCMAANRLVTVELRSLSSVYHCQGLLLRRCRIP